MPEDAPRDAVEAHYERFLGDCDVVLHEVASHTVHVDVHCWRATAARPVHTFATLGMSDLAMSVPDEALAAGVAARAELLVCLPAEAPFPAEGAVFPFHDAAANLPVGSLKELARLPHVLGTWLGFGHTVPHGEPARPFAAGSALVAWLLLPPVTLPASFARLSTPATDVDFFALVAITSDELDRTLQEGTSALLDAFDARGVTEVLDVGRASSLR